MFCGSDCPTAVQRDITMACVDFDPKGAVLTCRWRSGDTAPAFYDAEGSEFTCVVPQGSSDAEVPDLEDDSGEVVCQGVAKCTIRQRFCSTPALSDQDGTQHGEAQGEVETAAAAPHQSSHETSFTSVCKELSWADRLLSFWIVSAMVLGVILGKFTDISKKLETVTIGTVSLPIALGLWMMMWPVLTKVKYEVLGQLLREPGMLKLALFSVFVNWLVGPAMMTGLAWAALPDLPGYRNGVILVGLARCIAMVLLWNQMARGHAEYCAVLVAVNSIMQIVLYAPLAVFYIKVVSQQKGDFSVGFWEVARSVLIFLGVPLVAGITLRYGVMLAKGKLWLEKKFLPWFGPVALLALVYTVLILFALQAKTVLDNVGDVIRVAVPLLCYFVIMWTGTLLATRRLRGTYKQAVTQAFTASSNNFELAIAIAVGAFGVHSQEALAATIGPLIEVPTLLLLVYVALWLQVKLGWEMPNDTSSESG